MSIQTRYALPTSSSGVIPEGEDMEDIVDSFPPDDLFHFIPQEQLSSAGPSSVPLQSPHTLRSPQRAFLPVP